MQTLPIPTAGYPGAPRGPANGNFRTGYWTQEALAERRFIRQLLREARATLKQVVELT